MELIELEDLIWDYLDDLTKGGLNRNKYIKKFCEITGFNYNKIQK